MLNFPKLGPKDKGQNPNKDGFKCGNRYKQEKVESEGLPSRAEDQRPLLSGPPVRSECAENGESEATYRKNGLQSGV